MRQIMLKLETKNGEVLRTYSVPIKEEIPFYKQVEDFLNEHTEEIEVHCKDKEGVINVSFPELNKQL